jgi:fatty acid synthase subunit alpha
LLLSEFKTKKTVEIGPSDTLTTMMKRTHDQLYRPFDTANSFNRNFLSLKRNKPDVCFQRERVATPARKMKTSSPQTATPQSTDEAVPSTPPAAPVSTAVGPIEDAPVSAADIIRTVVAVALKKSPKDVSFDSSIKALSGGIEILPVQPFMANA